MKQFLLLSLLLLLQPLAHSQNQPIAIKGQVQSSDGKPLPAISVQIEGTPYGTLTDDRGFFSFKKLKPGKHVLKLSAVGLEAQEQTVEVTAGQTVEMNFVTRETALELGQVIVNAQKNRYARKSSESVARIPLKNLENAQVYATITSQLIKDQVLVDYRDAFRNVSGVNSLEQISNGRTSAFIRGFRTGNYMRNGVVASQLTATEIANLDRIEVIKGPSGTLFGSSYISYGGVVNRITKKPFDSAQTTISYTGGSYALSRIAVDVNAPLNKEKTALFRVNAAKHYTGSFQETGYQSNYFIAPSFSYKVNDKLTFFADMEAYSNQGTNTGIGFSPKAGIGMTGYQDLNKIYNRNYGSNDLVSNLKGYTFYTKAEYSINNNWSLSAVYNYAGVDATNQYQFLPSFKNADTIYRGIQRYSHNYYNQNAQVNLNGDVIVAGIRNRLVLGVDVNDAVTNPTYLKNITFDSVSIMGVTPYISMDKVQQMFSQKSFTSASKSKITYYGAYFSDVINILENLNVMIGGRLDKVDSRGTTNLLTGATAAAFTRTTFSPKAGVVYQLIKDKVSLFGNYLNGYTYSASVDKNGNHFNPEQANQLEGGVKTELMNGRLSVTANYYHIKVKDKLRSDPTVAASTGFQVQDGAQVSKGVELDIAAHPVNGLNIMAGYAYNDNQFTSGNPSIVGKIASHAPKHMANAFVNYRQPKGKLKGLGLGAGVNYNSISYYDDANTFTVPEFVVFNGVLSYDVQNWTLGLRVDNLTNQKYWGPWGNPQLPRNFAASVSFKF
ncbi:iron complex outermembrane recepter protein [Filimonas lacunae]|uniref:Iron complex outermembrane recepter protein n=1 Tax=Filimonas lacunae TaxID=477680 RepID=A0A173MN82_9BACT|nr:TonB-dependent receptor [Filimonas lacunae]BAV08929.1 ferrichrome-iron receptor [Filimonas lacunae]SIS64167.1 iron complex outermembrane recepter protein [Filimonas lacunae]